MKVLFNVVSLCMLPLALAATPNGPEVGAIEKRKTIIKLYDVSPKDNLLIDNQFGQVKVNLWDKEEIRVQITITSNANAEDRAQDYLNSVEIEEKRNGDQISLKTHLNKSGVSNWVWHSNNGEKNYVRIDYDVSMPRKNALSVRNQFGATNIPAFSAPLKVYSRYGSFHANDLQGRQNDIDVQYGKAFIQTIDGGKLDISYSSLELDKANVLILSNQFGKLKIGEVNRLDANINYSGAKIGTLRESGKIKLDFSSGFRIDQLAKSADNVDIQASYSTVALPITEVSDCNFDVTVSYGGFQYPSGQNIYLYAPSTDDKYKNSKTTKQYSGKTGSGSGTRVRVISKFGSVSFR